MRTIDLDHVPGTVYLVAVTGQASSAQYDTSHKYIVLVLRPSSDPNDPLNWSHRRKAIAVSMAYLYILGTGIATSLQYSVLADITKDTVSRPTIWCKALASCSCSSHAI